MFLWQITWAFLLIIILIRVIMLAQSAVRSMGALVGLRRLADVTPFAVRMRLVDSFFHLLRLCLFCTRFLFAKKTYGGVQCLCQVCLSQNAS
jgi:hypothetical protein